MAKKNDKNKKKPNERMGKREEKIGTVMDEFEKGQLRSGSKKGPKVKSRKQAKAIAMSEANKNKSKKKTSKRKKK